MSTKKTTARPATTQAPPKDASASEELHEPDTLESVVTESEQVDLLILALKGLRSKAEFDKLEPADLDPVLAFAVHLGDVVDCLMADAYRSKPAA